MAIRLSEEQRAEFEKQLSEGELTEEQAQQAVQEGMRMAHSDMQSEDGQAVQGDSARLAEYGFGSLDELLGAYERVQGTVTELRGMLSQLLDVRRAEQNAAQLDMRHPAYRLRRSVEEELRPLREQTEQAARNRLVQKDWQESAAQMADLEGLMPEIAAYIMEHPRYAQESDGLKRAYDAVRSGKYRDEEELLDDPQFIERAAGNGKIREAVMRAWMEQIKRTGTGVQSIGAAAGVGMTPLTQKKNVTGMEQAKKRLEAMLGVRG